MSAQNGLSSAPSGSSSLPPSAASGAAPAVASTASAAAPSGVTVQGEEFQRYLEKSGVIDALTKVLVGLYESPEKPSNAIDYVKEWLGVSVSGDGGVQSMLDSQQRLLAEREAEIAQLRRRVAQLEEEAAQRTRGVEGELPAAAEEAAAAAVIKVDAPSPVAS